MCIAVPVKLIKVDGPTGVVELGMVCRQINLELVEDVVIGDYVLLHAGCALQRIDKREAEETLRLLDIMAADIDGRLNR